MRAAQRMFPARAGSAAMPSGMRDHDDPRYADDAITCDDSERGERSVGWKDAEGALKNFRPWRRRP